MLPHARAGAGRVRAVGANDGDACNEEGADVQPGSEHWGRGGGMNELTARPQTADAGSSGSPEAEPEAAG